MAESLINQFIRSAKVTIFSKTYCPYCTRVKALFTKLNIKPAIMELDTRNDGSEIQTLLGSMTGASTVPRVFINGKFIGGCDDTYALHKAGKLTELLKE